MVTRAKSPVDSTELVMEHEAEWTAEIQRRVASIHEGRAKLIPAADVLAEARAVVARHRRR